MVKNLDTIKYGINFALSLVKHHTLDNTKAGRSSEQLLHNHTAKIVIRLHLCKFLRLNLINMVTRDTIRNLKPGYKLSIECSGSADLDSTYQTAYQVRKELGIPKDVMVISRLGTQNMVVVDYRKGGES